MVNRRRATAFNHFSTVVDVVRFQSTQQPNRRAYTFLSDGEREEVHLTYGELDRQSRAIGALLQSYDLAGKPVLLAYPPGLAFMSAFFGCLYAGAVAVPVIPPRLNRPSPRTQAIATNSGAKVALTDSSLLSKGQHFKHEPELESLQWLAIDTPAPGAEQGWTPPSATEESLALLQYTSGSTSTPKGVMLSHGNLLHNQAMIQQSFGSSTDDVGVCWLPHYHDMGLIGTILQNVYLGAYSVFMSPTAFLQKPIRWLRAISRYGGDVSGGPNFAYDLCVYRTTPEQRADLDLSHWQVAYTGAEPVRLETLKRFEAAFEPYGFNPRAFNPVYGLAEAALLVTGKQGTALPVTRTVNRAELQQHTVKHGADGDDKRTTVFIGCGTATDGEVAIVDPETLTRCSPGQVGEIWVANGSVGYGYWKRPAETEETFRASLADSGGGPFLRTGDLGFIEDGELFITGRLKNIIIIRGQNYYPEDIEHSVEECHPALQEGGAAAFSIDTGEEERLITVLELKRDYLKADLEEVVNTVRRMVSEVFELQAYAVMLVRPLSIPRTTSGKVQRYACRKAYLEGTLKMLVNDVLEATPEASDTPKSEESFVRKALLTVTSEDGRRQLLQHYVREQMAHHLRVEPSRVSAEISLGSLGLDSLKAIEFSHELETTLGVSLPMAYLINGPSMAELVDDLLDRLAATGDDLEIALLPSPERTAESKLSHNLRSLWFLQQLAPENAAYNIARAVRITGRLDAAALRAAFQALVDRHPALRTSFHESASGDPFQRVHDRVEVAFVEENASDWDEDRLNKRLTDEAYRPFDLAGDSQLRLTLFARSPEEHVLLLAVHHIVADFWSLALLANEVDELYAAEMSGDGSIKPPSPLQYTDYVRWQDEFLASPAGEESLSYWQEQLAGEISALNLPTDRPRPAKQTYAGALHNFTIDTEVARKLEKLAEAEGVTLYMILLAAFQTLLYRYTGREDILIGSPTTARTRAATANLMGYFVNSVVLRADLSGDPAFTEFLHQVRQTVLDALEHQDYPNTLLTEKLQPGWDASRPPLFQTMFIWQQAPDLGEESLTRFALGESSMPLSLGDLAIEPCALDQRTAHYDVSLMMAEVEGRIAGSLRYNVDLFDADTIVAMAGHLGALLEGIAADSGRSVSELPLLTSGERHRLLIEWNDTYVEYPPGECLHVLFERQASKTPQALAVAYEDKALTYDELNASANQIAHYLQTKGVGPETFVGIYLERSPELIASLIGVLKAGGAFLLLDPMLPRERLKYMMDDADTRVILTREGLAEHLAEHGAQIVRLDSDREAISRESTENPTSAVTRENTACAIYTSGSTGIPNGVAYLHESFQNRFSWLRSAWPFQAGEVCCQKSLMSFIDFSTEVFWPLLAGVPVVIIPEEAATHGAELVKILAERRVTRILLVPTLLREILNTGENLRERLPDLNLWIVSGERFPTDLARRLKQEMPGSTRWQTCMV